MAAEKQFENQIKRFLKLKKAWFIKYWAGAEFTRSGVPDILACINGTFYGIEVKAESGKPSMLQLITLQQIRDAGGIGILLYPKDYCGFIALLNRNDYSWYQENINFQKEWIKKLK